MTPLKISWQSWKIDLQNLSFFKFYFGYFFVFFCKSGRPLRTELFLQRARFNHVDEDAEDVEDPEDPGRS